MALPITIPYAFATATGALPLSQLDTDFNTVATAVNGIADGTNALPNVNITGGNITSPTITNATIANATYSGQPFSPTNGFRRNRIINGGMQIDQRNAGAAQTTAASTGAFTVDRWVVAPYGNSVTSQRVAGPPGYQYAYQMNGASGITNIYFEQRIESYNLADLVNQNVTLSAVISNSLLTTINWQAYSFNAVDNFSSGTTFISSGSFTVSSSPTACAATFNIGPNAANGIVIYFIAGAQTSGNWKITGVQLEPGSYATPFERLSIGEIRALCQRYYLGYGLTYAIPVGAAGSTNGLFGSWLFPTNMRRTPTLTYKDTAGNLGSVTVNNGTINITQGFSAGNIYPDTPQGFIIDAGWSFTGTPYGLWCKFQAAFDAEL